MGWQLASATTFTKQKLSFPTLNVKEAGYIFVYLSYDNDSNNWVYFDDLKVTHTQTNILQYNEYYPFGLQTSSSWTREGSTNNYSGTTRMVESIMRKKILISAILILINVLKMNSQTNMPVRSEMKIGDLVILVKYAQGAVVFNSFFGYLKFMKPPQRKIFLSQIVELTGHFLIDDYAADLVIRESGLSDTCTACLILKEGVYETQLQKILELPESELESSFKLLLTLFSIGYQEGYQKHKNAPTKFWYWDYSDVENTYKFIDLDDNQYVPLDEILRP